MFILKKDLALTRLSKSDDKPEHYALWKVTFQDVIQDLKCSSIQETDIVLLISWGKTPISGQ